LKLIIWFRVARFSGGEDRSKGSDPPPYRGSTGELLLNLEPDPLRQNIAAKNVFSSLCVLSESIWLDVTAALLEGFLGIDAVSGAGLAALEVCEVMSRHIAAA